MKIAIFRSDKDALRVKISQLLRGDPYIDEAVGTVTTGRGSMHYLRADQTARKIISLLEEEGVWDHVIED